VRRFRDISIRHKLTLIVLLTSAVAILLGAVISVVYETMRSRHELVSGLSAEAEIIGANSAAALAFRDQKAAQEILSALRFRRQVVYACL
jgi:sensor histidine kinase regulating citrate/malate metabolism